MQSACFYTIIIGSMLIVLAANNPAAAGDPPPLETIVKIQMAIPDKAPVQPAQPRRLLVYSDCKGSVHSSIPYGIVAIQIMGKKTGAFEAVVIDNPIVFKPSSLRLFDAVCFNNTTGELFDDPEWKKNLLDFVRGGKVVVGIHAAADCFYDWPEYGEMMGGYFAGHPWGANDTVTLKVDDPAHPLTAMFGGRPFIITDEIYQFREPYSRDKLRVLLSLDPSKTDMNKKGISRTDGDFAVSWVRNYGRGRVFYCSLGHREDIYWNPVVLRHYLAGIQYALGDLPADALASGQLDADGWARLFNGKDLTGWIAKPGSWTVADGVLTRKGGGEIWSEQTFGDFILDLEFKLAPKTNSGVFLRTGDIGNWLNTTIEMQLNDDIGNPRLPQHTCGAIYDCLVPSKSMAKPPGEWNHVTITCKGPQINIVMNGEQIIDMNLDDWTEPGKNPDGTPNKFKTAYKDMPRRGHIGLQDHGDPVWYRNIRIKRLD